MRSKIQKRFRQDRIRNENIRQAILHIIEQYAPIAVEGIMAQTELERPLVERVVKNLREKGLILSRPNIQDMRKCFYERVHSR